jgi:hypothetical protein
MDACWEAGHQTAQEGSDHMSRNLKALGLAALALLAIGAMAAPAQAGKFTAGTYPATITGQNIGFHHLTTVLGTMTCAETKSHGLLTEESESLTLSVDFGTSCTLEGNVVHVKSNGCDFHYKAGETTGTHKVDGAVQVRCPTGNAIDFEITSMQVCHLTVGEQAALEHVVFTNNTMPSDVDVDLHLTGLIYQLDLGCPFVGTFGGTYVGTTTLKADAEGGVGTPFKVD